MIQSEFVLVTLLCLLRLSGNLVHYYVNSRLKWNSSMKVTTCVVYW